ncbi:extracellular solute-binding protein [Bacillus lacus]|uniref:Extracellular solute-binding protein n=1 Tax=Metabacillus lacus TaxID=1983721 RepID=A0A7X2J0G5_9BACI|nr:extracellular solute-binding protein [Metabacillus lacus]MRX72478.1 extracellular solute-binding protein [Metabacillus lacus]
MKGKNIFIIAALVLFFGSYFGYKSYYERTFANTEQGKIEISFLNGFTGGDGAYMRKITEGFNQSQDQYHVVEHQERDHYTKFKSGNQDLVVIHGTNLETYQKDTLIQDISPIMEMAGLEESDFHQAGIESSTIDGKMFAVPLDIHPMTMLYNKELVSEPVENYEDILALNERLQSQSPNLYAMGIPPAGLVEYYIMTMAAQKGIELKKDNYLNFHQPELADALLEYNKMIWEDSISPPGLGADGEFQAFMKQAGEGSRAVQTALALTGPWFYGGAKEQFGDSLGVAPVPVLGDTQAVYGNAHTIAMSSAVEDPQVKEGIAAFLHYMFTPENLVNWAEGGQAPLHLQTIEYLEQNQEQYEVAYANTLQFDSFAPAPKVYLFDEQMRYMNATVFNRVVSNRNLTKEDLMRALDHATDRARQISEAEPTK